MGDLYNHIRNKRFNENNIYLCKTRVKLVIALKVIKKDILGNALK